MHLHTLQFGNQNDLSTNFEMVKHTFSFCLNMWSKLKCNIKWTKKSSFKHSVLYYIVIIVSCKIYLAFCEKQIIHGAMTFCWCVVWKVRADKESLTDFYLNLRLDKRGIALHRNRYRLCFQNLTNIRSCKLEFLYLYIYIVLVDFFVLSICRCLIVWCMHLF